MKQKSITTIISIITMCLICSSAPAKQEESDRIVAAKWKEINGKAYFFEKHLGDDGEVRTVITDIQGNVVNEKDLRPAKRELIEPKLKKKLREINEQLVSGQTIKVNIALELPKDDTQEVSESGEVEINDGVVTSITLNGKKVTEDVFEEHQNAKEIDRSKRAAGLRIAREAHLRAWAKRNGLGNHEAVERLIDSTSSTLTVELTAEEIEELDIINDGTIRGIELFEEPKEEINQAMVDTSISTSAHTNNSTRGSGIGIYMTEPGCAANSRITNYSRLAGTETDHSRNVGAILRAVSPDSFIYCRGGDVLPTRVDLTTLNPPIRVINRSSGNNYDTFYTSLDRDWDNFIYDNNIPIFKSAGNEGKTTGYVSSPGKGLNVITVGNYDDATDTINSGSSFVDPQTGNEKPEICAPGTDITAGTFTMTGTSQASPHAAAFAADMMSGYTYLRGKPYLVKAAMLAGATDSITGGSDKVGLGGIDFLSAYYSGYDYWYEGDNSSFASYAANDGIKNSLIEKKVYLWNDTEAVRIVLSWLTRGNYTFDHRNDALAIGMDLDLWVYDPYGNFVAGSSSWDNPFEYVEFKPTVSGYYKIEIQRYANRDTANNLRVGVSVNFFDR
jgi:hypothetical protein